MAVGTWPDWKMQLGEYPPEMEALSAEVNEYILKGLNTMWGKIQGNKFLNYFFQKCDQGFLEIRHLREDQPPRREFFAIETIMDLGEDFFPPDRDMHFGIATRDGKGGTKDNLLQFPALWVDYDLPPDTFQKKLDKEGVPRPSSSVCSGQGLHAYWLLNQPAASKEMDQIEAINKGLALRLGADMAAANAARIMRLPGTVNQKVGRMAKVEWMENLFYDLEEFRPFVVSKASLSPEHEKRNPPGWYREILEGVSEGERNIALTRLTGRYLQKGLDDPEILPILMDTNRKFHPPLEDKEVESILASVIRTSAKNGAQRAVTDFHFSDTGNAERLVNSYGEDLRYCKPWGQWLIWDGRKWAQDETNLIKEFGKEVARDMYLEAGDESIGPPDYRKHLAAFALGSESKYRIDAMIDLAQPERQIAVLPEHFDKDPWLLNCLNGTLDLRTGELMPYRRGDLITKIANTSYDAEARCPIFESFLDRIFDGNPRLIGYLQRVIGYSLTGSTKEQCLFFFYGTGANGKSTLLELIQALLGDYARRTDFSTFLIRKNETVRNDLARLFGVRAVIASESEAERRLAEVLVKELTGGDTISARFLYQEYFEFRPSFKIFLAANHKPEIRGTDHAIWRRIRLIPFSVTIPLKEQDKELPAKLRQEFPGILSWAVKGCLKWRDEKGLNEPGDVTRATQKYQIEMDILGEFISERCTLGEKESVMSKALYGAYKDWAESNGERILSMTAFGRRLTERGIERRHAPRTEYLGIGLKTVKPN